jgi:hypothetical protein
VLTPVIAVQALIAAKNMRLVEIKCAEGTYKNISPLSDQPGYVLRSVEISGSKVPQCAFCGSMISRICEAANRSEGPLHEEVTGFIDLPTLIEGSKTQCPDCILLHNAVQLPYSSAYAEASAVVVELDTYSSISNISQIVLQFSLGRLVRDMQQTPERGRQNRPDETCRDSDCNGLSSGERHVSDRDLDIPVFPEYCEQAADQMNDGYLDTTWEIFRAKGMCDLANSCI